MNKQMQNANFKRNLCIIGASILLVLAIILCIIVGSNNSQPQLGTPLSNNKSISEIKADSNHNNFGEKFKQEYAPKQVIVLTDENITENQVKAQFEDNNIEVESTELLMDGIYTHTKTYGINYTQDIDAKELSKFIEENTDFVCEPNYVQHLCEDVDASAEDATDPQKWQQEVANMSQSFNEIPNDCNLTRDWGLGAVGAYDAWDIQKAEDTTATVAILDTGIDIDHPDLQYAIRNTKNYCACTVGSTQVGLQYCDDEHSHGTHCSGIVSATSNNGIGISGASYGANILFIRISQGSAGCLNDYDILRGYNYLLQV
ncbi:MAG: S8 family serine peptidase, partial [Clostridia bacterium]|nr:S8 family serine peptidase [Clostridia bacterium]